MVSKKLPGMWKQKESMSTPQILLKYQSDEIKFMIYERANSER
jgi:hypothetical protein